MTGSELPQYGLVVVADCRHLQTMLTKLHLRLLQFDQLHLAPRSPISRPDKEKDETLWSYQRLKSLRPVKLIARPEPRNILTTSETLVSGLRRPLSNRRHLTNTDTCRHQDNRDTERRRNCPC